MITALRHLVQRLVLPGLIVVASAGLSGCVLVAVGAAAAGAVAYVKGDLEATFPDSHATVVTAVDGAITELGFFRLNDQRDAVTASFTMRNAKDDRITIAVKKTGDSLTTVVIRVGLLGDEALSRTILDAIKKRL